MMTVQALIDQLQKVEDKNKEVMSVGVGTYYPIDHVIDKSNDRFNNSIILTWIEDLDPETHELNYD